ncbi:hypothetical protein RHSIM_Rhsim02G0044900 [Rhododendron simsii]|uniref:Uncharacterized protein n=1 Tax=Rhododendron simsii TaxID=118357 RepID=A0A834HAU8_RHOSS|nr:hypothetical protein RHSIM_Rhsim02G0044900 [Rhododendron simsii]
MVKSTYQVSNSEAEEEDDEVDNTNDDKDSSNKKEGNLLDDMEKQSRYSDDMARNKEEEVEKGENSDINGCHQSGLEKEPIYERPSIQEKSYISKTAFLGNLDTGERINEESTNSTHGLDSIVQDSQSPLIEDCSDSVKNGNARGTLVWLSSATPLTVKSKTCVNCYKYSYQSSSLHLTRSACSNWAEN